MPRFTTSELRDVDEEVFGDAKIKKEFQDLMPQFGKHPHLQIVRIKEEPNDNVSPFLEPWLSASNQQNRKRSRDVLDSIESDVHSNSSRVGSSVPSQRARKRKSKGLVATCAACLDELPARRLITLQCSCQDFYCRECLETWYSATLQSKQFPRCCDQELIDNHVYDLLSAKTRRRWSDVLEERDKKEIEKVEPLYCKSCRQYIRASQIKNGFGTCPTCKTKTCTECKSLVSQHKGIYNLCPSYLNDSAFANLGPNFRRCPKCYFMIEKASGCNELR